MIRNFVFEKQFYNFQNYKKFWKAIDDKKYIYIMKIENFSFFPFSISPHDQM